MEENITALESWECQYNISGYLHRIVRDNYGGDNSVNQSRLINQIKSLL